MGTVNDAILFYGYCWDEEADQPWTISCEDEDEHPDEEWEDRYARKKGLSSRQRANWNKVRELALGSGCFVSTHCSAECPMPFVAVAASLIQSHRGQMNEVKGLGVDPAWDGMLAKFCKTLDIQIDKLRPAWWLVSDCS